MSLGEAMRSKHSLFAFDMTHDNKRPHLPAWGQEVSSFPLSKPEFAAEALCVMCRRAPRKCVFTFISRPVKQTHCMCPSVSLLHRSMSPSARLCPPALVVVEWVETYFNAFLFVIVKKYEMYIIYVLYIKLCIIIYASFAFFFIKSHKSPVLLIEVMDYVNNAADNHEHKALFSVGIKKTDAV